MSKRVRGKNQKTNILREPKSYLSINKVAQSREKKKKEIIPVCHCMSIPRN
jgi:hypothetical protein